MARPLRSFALYVTAMALVATAVALGSQPPAGAQCEQGDSQNQIVCPGTSITPPPPPTTPTTMPTTPPTTVTTTPTTPTTRPTTTDTTTGGRPTVARDDTVRGTVGQRILTMSVLDNDDPSITTLRVDQIAGSPPAGLTLWSSGSVSGTPTEDGTFTLTYRLESTSGSTDTAVVTFIIEDDPYIPPPPPQPEACYTGYATGDLFTRGLAVIEPTNNFAPNYNFHDSSGRILYRSQDLVETVSARGPADWRTTRGGYKREWEISNNPGLDPRQVDSVTSDDGNGGARSAPVFCHYFDTCPIGLDLDHSGAVERIAGRFALDITADGRVDIITEWFAPTEGILLDASDGLPADGRITGHHLLGDEGGRFTDGFDKLARRDADGDGLVAGSELDGLMVWTDGNSNATVDHGELQSLGAVGVTALSTSHDAMVSTAELADGSIMMTEDLWFPLVGADPAEG